MAICSCTGMATEGVPPGYCRRFSSPSMTRTIVLSMLAFLSLRSTNSFVYCSITKRPSSAASCAPPTIIRHRVWHTHRCGASSSVPSSNITNETITVPEFYPHDTSFDEGSSYPSPLHSIHVESLLTAEETAMCLKLSQSYAAETGRWDRPDEKRHATYATCDFAVEECEPLQTFLQQTIKFDNRMWSRLSHRFGVDTDDMSYLDLFCVNYQATSDGNEAEFSRTTMDRLEAHRDGSLLSFSVLLSPPSSFEGGGTFFEALRDVETAGGRVNTDEAERVLYSGGVIRPPRAGDCVLHSGKLLHGADVVTSGSRTVLVGFIDVADWCQRPGVLGEACREFGRMDVAAFHNKRRLEKTEAGRRKGWILNNSRWLPDTNRAASEGRSYIRGYRPAFSSIASRGDPEFQRRRKLQAEDVLLRSILLPDKPTFRGIESLDGDMTIL